MAIQGTHSPTGSPAPGASSATVGRGFTSINGASIAEAVAFYTSIGWAVFPVNGKQPATQRGFHDASTDPQRFLPGASGIGVACGASGLFVIDIDPGHGGDASFEELEATHGRLPPTLTARTGGGGRHLIYRGSGPSTAGRLGEGIDSRSEGGYIVVAPSPHPSGGVYQWLNDLPIADAPTWVLELAAAKHRQPVPRLGEEIREGGRNTALIRQAGLMRAMGATNEAIEATLRSLNLIQCKPPLPDDEVDRIIASAQGFEQGPPLVVLVDSLEGADEGVPYEIRTTDLGNALRLERRYGDRVIYVHDLAQWYTCNGGLWRASDSGQVERLAIDTVVSISDEAQALRAQYEQVQAEYLERNRPAFANEGPPDPTLTALRGRLDALARDIKRLEKHAVDSQSAGKIAATLSVARARERLSRTSAQLDSDPFLLGVANGVVDLRTGVRRPARAADLITKRTNIAFDPEATCPQWERFLEQIMCGDKALVRYLQQAVGYTLTGSVQEQLFFFLYGDGNNGKSVFTSILHDLLGDYGVVGAQSLIEEDRTGNRQPYDLMLLQGARCVTVTETDEAKNLPEASIKRLTGGESITARSAYQRGFSTFAPTHKLWISGNYRPEIRGGDSGIWRRLRIIPFRYTVREHERDPRLVERLCAELPGILAWGVRGCLEWQRHGLITPQVVRDATAEYRNESDVIGQFLQERVAREVGDTVAAQDLFEAYTLWCQANGVRDRERVSRRNFKSAVERHGFTQSRDMRRSYWNDMALVSLSSPKSSTPGVQ